MDEWQDRAGIAVLGMSRSGTSAVAGIFRAAGFYLGSDAELMAPDQHNPRGYNENLRVHGENERILQGAGASWFGPPQPEALAGRDELRALRSLLEELRLEAAGAPILIKDPRVGVLLTLWGELIQEYLHPILVIRDPLEIALSLCARDGIPPSTGVAGWELHMTSLLGALRDRPVTVARYETLLGDPGGAHDLVTEAAHFIDPVLLEGVDPLRADGVAEAELRRHRAGDDHSAWLSGFQAGLWRYLGSLETGTRWLEVPPELLEPTPMARRAVAAESKRIADLEAARDLRAHHDHLLSELERCRVEFDRVQAELGVAQASGAALGPEVERLGEATRRAESESARLSERNQQLLAERELAQRELQRLTTILEAVTQSSSWRLTRPLREARELLRERQRPDRS